MSEARELNHSYVGTEHLLLGLLREKAGIAARVLGGNGVTLEQARAETLRLLTTEMPSGPTPRLTQVDTRRSLRGCASLSSSPAARPAF